MLDGAAEATKCLRAHGAVAGDPFDLPPGSSLPPRRKRSADGSVHVVTYPPDVVVQARHHDDHGSYRAADDPGGPAEAPNGKPDESSSTQRNGDLARYERPVVPDELPDAVADPGPAGVRLEALLELPDPADELEPARHLQIPAC